MSADSNNVQDTPVKKKWYERTSGKVIIGSIVFLLVVGALTNDPENTPVGDSTAPATQTANPETVTEKESEPAVDKTWQKVATLSGENSKRGDVFTLSGAKARLKYTIEGQYPSLNVYVVKEGESLQESGGFPEVIGADKAGETMLVQPAGNYYFDVSGSGSWTVTIEELK